MTPPRDHFQPPQDLLSDKGPSSSERIPAMTPHSLSSPVSLSYVASLRGLSPRPPGASFTYALVNCRQPALLTCLAASNPEGQFYGFVGDSAARAKADSEARAGQVDNVHFVAPGATVPPLNYLCADDIEAPLSQKEREALFDLAESALIPGGLLHYRYRAYDNESGSLRFLVREFAPEMNVEQAKVFLLELKALGGHYFSGHPAAAIRLNEAIASGVPDEFFGDYEGGVARSGSIETLMGLLPRGLTYAGDADIAANYLDLAVPPSGQTIILESVQNPLYESLKDFALNRSIRADIWCRGPVTPVADLPELFGGFSYGIVGQKDGVPDSFKAQGKTVDLSSPLFRKLTGLMSLLPISIGDFLAHPDGAGFSALEVVGAVQILVACGIAQPMRGLYRSRNVESVAQPRFAGAFNKQLGQTVLSGEDMWLASQAIGSAVSVSAKEALVMQALDRGGLANSVSVLLPELQRLALHGPSDA
ncbi:MAG: methyltransferase regulatory domain-containing protein, partial [Pseudomonadota bacterium]|nr:methyltransferase regulatory domain-containing protein [Pseudomonadota bacterium]